MGAEVLRSFRGQLKENSKAVLARYAAASVAAGCKLALRCLGGVALDEGVGERSGTASSSITANQLAKLQKQVDSNSQVLKEVSEQLLVIDSIIFQRVCRSWVVAKRTLPKC